MTQVIPNNVIELIAINAHAAAHEHYKTTTFVSPHDKKQVIADVHRALGGMERGYSTSGTASYLYAKWAKRKVAMGGMEAHVHWNLLDEETRRGFVLFVQTVKRMFMQWNAYAECKQPATQPFLMSCCKHLSWPGELPQFMDCLAEHRRRQRAVATTLLPTFMQAVQAYDRTQRTQLEPTFVQSYAESDVQLSHASLLDIRGRVSAIQQEREARKRAEQAATAAVRDAERQKREAEEANERELVAARDKSYRNGQLQTIARAAYMVMYTFDWHCVRTPHMEELWANATPRFREFLVDCASLATDGDLTHRRYLDEFRRYCRSCCWTAGPVTNREKRETPFAGYPGEFQWNTEDTARCWVGYWSIMAATELTKEPSKSTVNP